MIFVDTSAWFALLVPEDHNHERACGQHERIRGRVLATSSFVLDELFTLLRARGAGDRVAAAGALLLNPEHVFVEHVGRAEFMASWALFQRFPDKGWSFTDCSSFVLMNRLGVDAAFAFDRHFEQYGVVPVLSAWLPE